MKREYARQLRRQMTPAETALWECLRANRLDGLHFRREQVVDGFIVDFFCAAAGLVVEVDGAIHQEQPREDEGRTQILQRRGLRVLRLSNEDVLQRMSDALARIRAACQS
jgi:very-short-patch-repair endonuclease